MKKIFFLALIIYFQVAYAQFHPATQYLYPIPDTEYHPKETQIIIRFKDISPNQLDNLNSFIKISGEKSGTIDGKTVVSTDSRTIIFKPYLPFIPGEKVRVSLAPQKKGAKEILLDTNYHFSISTITDETPILLEDEIENKKTPLKESLKIQDSKEGYPIVRNGISIPSDFPWVEITVNDNPDSGYIFLCPYGRPYFTMILDNSGDPVWYWKTDDRRRDFKVQKDGRLSMLVTRGYGGGSHIALDATYTVVDTFFYPLGYRIDEHELQVLPNGHYFLIVTDSRYINMSDSVVGGNPNARVIANHVAEMDANDNLVFFWRSWDHFSITDAVSQDLTASVIDFVHMNAIEIDHDGHLLISSRNIDEVTKINHQTGEIIWRLGGVKDDFTWINDETRISGQHDIRVLADGNYTIFDNGKRKPAPRFSRSLEVKLDTSSWEATKVWEHREEGYFSQYLGSTQRLPNQNTLINWAVSSLPKLHEVRPDGSIAFLMDFVNSYECYRTFRFPWKGKASVPQLLIESWDDRITLLFNKFGDSDVVQYNIFGGNDPNPDQFIANTPEPFIHLRYLKNLEYYYFRVTAVNSDGEESGFSNEERVYVNMNYDGQNMVYNGDFSHGFSYWKWQVDSTTASADWNIDSTEVLHIQITDGGKDYQHVQVSYPNLRLLNEREYLFEFDAYADDGRVIEAEIKKYSEPYTNYSQIGYSWVEKTKTHFSHQFKMGYPNDYSACIIFNVGSSTEDIYFDNVSLKEVVTGIVDKDRESLHYFALHSNYPNPFNPTTTITYLVPELSHVTITLYNVLGERVEELINLPHNPGEHQVILNAIGLSSGVYFYKMEAISIQGQKYFSDVMKMILIK